MELGMGYANFANMSYLILSFKGTVSRDFSLNLFYPSSNFSWIYYICLETYS
jgi:hypothetical protein